MQAKVEGRIFLGFLTVGGRTRRRRRGEAVVEAEGELDPEAGSKGADRSVTDGEARVDEGTE